MDYLKLGKIIDTFSLDGSVKIFSTTTNQDIRFQKGKKVFIQIEDEYKELTVSSYRHSPKGDILRFDELTNVDDAALLKGKELFVIKDRNDLKEGYYFYSDLIGCVTISSGEKVGVVIDVEEYPAQVTLKVKANKGKIFYVPFVKAFIKSVNIESKQIDIVLLEGMLWKSQS